MSRLKIAIYAIALNEERHAHQWAQAAADADYRVVADTGSTDRTCEILREEGVSVYDIAIRPWRFDDARNTCLALIPADVDVCVTVDMDEFLEPGWRAHLEAAWAEDTTELWCQKKSGVSATDPNARTWAVLKFHSRFGYRIRRAVHETVFRVDGPVRLVNCPEIVVREVQDLTKGTRSQYLPLLELANREDPGDGQVCFWLARDLMYAGRHDESVRKFKDYLALPTSRWAEERAEAMRFLSRVEPENRLAWLDRARSEAPHRRETWLDLAEYYHEQFEWLNLYWACMNGLERSRLTNSYLDERSAWNFRLHDLGALAALNLNMFDIAVELGRQALDQSPDDQRLKSNLDYYSMRFEEHRKVRP